MKLMKCYKTKVIKFVFILIFHDIFKLINNDINLKIKNFNILFKNIINNLKIF